MIPTINSQELRSPARFPARLKPGRAKCSRGKCTLEYSLSLRVSTCLLVEPLLHHLQQLQLTGCLSEPLINQEGLEKELALHNAQNHRTSQWPKIIHPILPTCEREGVCV